MSTRHCHDDTDDLQALAQHFAADQDVMQIPFDNSYARLPDTFFTRQSPAPVAAPQLLRLNTALANDLGLDEDWLRSEAGIAMLAGNSTPAGSEPIATVYAGHQFGNWNPQLGDGRAVLLGELLNSHGQRFDLQLKGSGPTPYSRGGDGRSPIGPVLREYIVSEAMHALGIPTTRSLAAVASGEPVFRESLLPGGVLTRVARSHIRIGTFEFFAAREDIDSLQQLADHTIERHYPALVGTEKPYLGLLRGFTQRLATLISQWQQIGFIHGVMNTDNMLLSGETVDYGPCAFMDAFHPQQVFSAIDTQGRYAFQNQPRIGQWNAMILAQALLPLIDDNAEQAVAQAREVLDEYPTLYQQHHLQGMAAKLGLTAFREDDTPLIQDFFTHLTDHALDYTRTLAQLSRPQDHALLAIEFAPWKDRWLTRCGNQPDYATMQTLNPVCIPRNHLIEAAITAAVEEDDYSMFTAMTEALQTPFDPALGNSSWSLPPNADEVVQRTFCGT